MERRQPKYNYSVETKNPFMIMLISIVLVLGGSSLVWFFLENQKKEEQEYISTVVMPEIIKHLEMYVRIEEETQELFANEKMTQPKMIVEAERSIKDLELLKKEVEQVEFVNLSPENEKLLNEYYAAFYTFLSFTIPAVEGSINVVKSAATGKEVSLTKAEKIELEKKFLNAKEKQDLYIEKLKEVKERFNIK